VGVLGADFLAVLSVVWCVASFINPWFLVLAASCFLRYLVSRLRAGQRLTVVKAAIAVALFTTGVASSQHWLTWVGIAVLAVPMRWIRGRYSARK